MIEHAVRRAAAGEQHAPPELLAGQLGERVQAVAIADDQHPEIWPVGSMKRADQLYSVRVALPRVAKDAADDAYDDRVRWKPSSARIRSRPPALGVDRQKCPAVIPLRAPWLSARPTR